MISFEFRAHPLMFFRIIKPYLFVLILPFVRAFLQYVTIGKSSGTILLEFIAIVFVSVLAFCGWKAIKIGVKKNKLVVEKGFFIKSYSAIDISLISSISIKQNIIDRIIGSVTCAINTESGRFNKNDFEFKLYKNDAKILQFLLYGGEKTKKVSFSFFKIALLAVGTSSVITGVIIGLPILNKMEDIVNIAVSEAIFDEINLASTNIVKYFSLLFNLITTLFIAAYGTSFLFSLIKKINFKLNIGKNIIKVQYGLVSHKTTTFKKQSINNICFEQRAIMRFINKYSMRASIAGYGDNKGENAIIAPLISKNSFKKHLKAYFGYISDDNAVLIPNHDIKTHNRFLFISTLIFVFTIPMAVIFFIRFEHLGGFILLLTVTILCGNLYYASICYHNYKNTKILLSDVVVLSGSMGFKIKELYCAKEKVGIIKISQTPADRRFKTCKIKLIVRSQSADAIKVKILDKKSVLEGINKIYKTNVNV